MDYKVIVKFRDLQDNDRIYEVGEKYEGKKTKARITELSTEKNNIGKPVIEEMKEKGE